MGGGSRVNNPVGVARRGECHRAERVGEGLRIPGAPNRGLLHTKACWGWSSMLQRKWRHGRVMMPSHEGLLLVQTGHVGLLVVLRKAGTWRRSARATRPHLDGACPWVEEGRPLGAAVRTVLAVLGALGTTLATPTAAAPATTTTRGGAPREGMAWGSASGCC